MRNSSENGENGAQDISASSNRVGIALNISEQNRTPDSREKEEFSDEEETFEGHPVIDGYVNIPDTGWVMHPKFFETIKPLCDYRRICKHGKKCAETRLSMAVHGHMRTGMPLRRLAKLWGVPRANISRRKVEIENRKRSDMALILNPES